MAEDYPGIRHYISRAYGLKVVLEDSMEVMLASLSAGSMKQYDTELKKWWNFCNVNRIDPLLVQNRMY